MDSNTTPRGDSPPQHRARPVVSILATLVAIAVIVLIFLTELPWVVGLIIATVVLVPCQIYLNMTKRRQR